MSAARKSLWLLAAALAVAASPAPAAVRSLGSGGELYVARTGSYGELFAGGTEAAADAPVMALEIARADQAVERLLIPGSAGAEEETPLSLLFENSSRTAFLLWETRLNALHSYLSVAGYGPDGWTDVVQIAGGVYAVRGVSRLAVTRDSYTEPSTDGSLPLRDRTVVHVVFWEETGGGQAVYMPLVFLDGVHQENPASYVLNPFAAGGGPGARDFSSDLARTVAVQAGPDPQSVVVGFIDAASGRLVTLSVRALPGDLSSLADEARSHIVVLGSRYFPGQLPALADALRDYLRLAGGRLHPSVRDYLAEQSRLWVLDPTGGGAAGDLQALADGARSHIVVLGATLPGGQMRNAALPATVNLLELAAAASRVPLNLAVSVAAQLDAPATGPGPTRLLVSPSGEAVIVAWEDGNLLQYRESAGDRWTRVRGLALGPALSLEDAYRVLDERLRSR